MIGKYKIKDIFTVLVYCIVLFGLFSSYPYVFNVYLPFPPLSVVSVLILLCIGIVCLIYKPLLCPLPSIFNKVVLLQFICWFLYIIIHRDIDYIERIIYMIDVYMMVLCLHNCLGGLQYFFEKYDKFITIMGVLGAIGFFVVFFTDMSPFLVMNNKDGREAYCYLFTCTNTVMDNIIRVAGYFDEPGAMAHWGVWAILFNKVFFDNPKVEKCLIISLIFTFSMAYYIQLVLYIVFFKIKKVWQGILIVCAFGLVIVGILKIQDQYPSLYNLTLHRFEQDDIGQLKGDNRTELMKIAKENFESSPIFGIGSSVASQKEYMADNPFETLAFDGVVGTFITYLPMLLLWNLKIKNIRTLRLILIILGIGFLQRPFHHYILYYFIVYGFTILSLGLDKTKLESPKYLIKAF